MNAPRYAGKNIDQSSIRALCRTTITKLMMAQKKVWLGLKITEGGNSIQLKAREHTIWMSVQKFFGYGGWERSNVNDFLTSKDVQKLIPNLLRQNK